VGKAFQAGIDSPRRSNTFKASASAISIWRAQASRVSAFSSIHLAALVFHDHWAVGFISLAGERS